MTHQSDTEALFKHLLDQHRVVLVGLTDDETTTNLKLMLKKEIGIDDLFVLYEDNPPHPMEKAALSEVLWRLCKTRETPRVFIGGEYIGGWEGILDIHTRDKLVPMLQDLGYKDIPRVKGKSQYLLVLPK